MRSLISTNEAGITKKPVEDLNESNKLSRATQTYLTALNRSPNAGQDVTSDSPYCLNLFFRTRGYDLLRPVGRELTHILATQGVVS